MGFPCELPYRRTVASIYVWINESDSDPLRPYLRLGWNPEHPQHSINWSENLCDNRQLSFPYFRHHYPFIYLIMENSAILSMEFIIIVSHRWALTAGAQLVSYSMMNRIRGVTRITTKSGHLDQRDWNFYQAWGTVASLVDRPWMASSLLSNSLASSLSRPLLILYLFSLTGRPENSQVHHWDRNQSRRLTDRERGRDREYGRGRICRNRAAEKGPPLRV